MHSKDVHRCNQSLYRDKKAILFRDWLFVKLEGSLYREKRVAVLKLSCIGFDRKSFGSIQNGRYSATVAKQGLTVLTKQNLLTIFWFLLLHLLSMNFHQIYSLKLFEIWHFSRHLLLSAIGTIYPLLGPSTSRYIDICLHVNWMVIDLI